jgi:DNA-binding Xre family transcriptional regulator
MISFAPLWRTMQQKGITTYYIRNKCGDLNVSGATVRRLKSNQSISTNTLDSLCKILKCKLSDVIEFKDD